MTFAVSTDIITNGMGETIMTDQIGILTRGGGGGLDSTVRCSINRVIWCRFDRHITMEHDFNLIDFLF